MKLKEKLVMLWMYYINVYEYHEAEKRQAEYQKAGDHIRAAEVNVAKNEAHGEFNAVETLVEGIYAGETDSLNYQDISDCLDHMYDMAVKDASAGQPHTIDEIKHICKSMDVDDDE